MGTSQAEAEDGSDQIDSAKIRRKLQCSWVLRSVLTVLTFYECSCPREVDYRNRSLNALTNEILYEKCDLHTSALYFSNSLRKF